MVRIVTLSCSFLVGLAAAAPAADLHVNQYTGSDVTGTGALAAPFRTIGKGLGIAQPGDQVLVAPGVYSAASGEVFPLSVASGVSLESTMRSWNTVIDGAGVDWTGISGMVLLAGDAVVRGFTFRDGPTTDWWSAAITGWGPGDVTISDNVFLGPNMNRGLILYDLSATATSVSSAIVTNNVCAGTAPADGLLVFDYTSVLLAHNTADGTTRTGAVLSQINTTMTGQITNNNFTNNGYFGLEVTAPGVSLHNNNFFGNQGAVTGTFASQTGSLAADPRYADPSAADLHLRPNSPLRDKGIATTSLNDFDGEDRSQDSAPDIGADEVVSPGTFIRAPFELISFTAIGTIGTPGKTYVQLIGFIPANIPTTYGTFAFDLATSLILVVGTLPMNGYAATPITVPVLPSSTLGFSVITQSLIGPSAGGLSKAKVFSIIDG